MEATQIDYQGVRFSDEGIAAMVGARRDKFVPRREIDTIRLKYGRAGDRIWFEAAFGLVCVLAGLWLSMSFISWLFYGGRMSFLVVAGTVMLLGLGGWALWDAFREQWYFEIETSDMGLAKIGFVGSVDEKVLKDFLQHARQMGYQVDDARQANSRRF